ncbi:CGNR zinc finger domain-containing protein [Bosea sp. 124]|uniref:CGNR zinc finger domain-containing protein n=1 Tax=Bosea sp. 124 TaxID=2135642 RepID=UPI000D33B6A6|nr:CGNR zinc finger domain-containing protein [Bosea sp. 124]PTM43511.1 putative RNA-binding Zn ribbon-like protein [Bosea sp. 124]
MPGRSDAAGEFRHGMPFVGGRLWLDLLNTVMTDGVTRTDVIATADAASTWLAVAEIAAPARGVAISEELVALRERLRPAVDLLRTGEPLPAAMTDAVNDLLARIAIRLHLDMVEGQPHLRSQVDWGTAGPTGLIAQDFARFVCDAEPERLKHCASPDCSLVFYDQGKNNTRRWCSMSACGNRDKVARYRARQRRA